MITRRNTYRPGLGAAALLASTACMASAHADSTAAPTTQQLEAQIQALQQELNSVKTAQAAAPAPVAEPAQAPSFPKGDGSLTLYGITLYGTVDLGVTYQTHGTPLSSDLSTGLEYLVSKNSNQHYFGFGPNGLSQSKIGLKGSEDLSDVLPGFSAVFKLETSFLPTSGMLSDSVGAMAHNNGVPLNQQTSNADSSRAGQIFNQQAYAGLSSPVWGTLTFGRQYSLELDGIVVYDPMGGSNAFSVIGYSGVTGGFGVTQAARLDNTVKYVIKAAPVRFGFLYQFPQNSGTGGRAYEFDVGADYQGFSIDALYNNKKDEISASPLSSLLNPMGIPYPTNSLQATISDNWSTSIMARYELDPFKAYFGWEHIFYANPTDPIPVNYTDIGGYTLSVVNNAAYLNNKQLDVFWLGGKYAVNSNVDLTGAWYHYNQNSYHGDDNCKSAAFSSCSGTLDAFSGVADYKFSHRFDIYGGAMYSIVDGGLASGYLHRGSIDPMIGARFNF